MIWYKGWRWDVPWGWLSTRQKVQLKRSCAFKPDRCLLSLSWGWMEAAWASVPRSLLSKSLPTCLSPWPDWPDRQPLGPMSRSTSGSSHNPRLKLKVEVGGKRGVKPNPWLDPLLAIKAAKFVACPICELPKQGSLFQDASESSPTAWPTLCLYEAS